MVSGQHATGSLRYKKKRFDTTVSLFEFVNFVGYPDVQSIHDFALVLVLIRASADTAASTHACSRTDALLLRLRAVNNDRVGTKGCTRSLWRHH